MFLRNRNTKIALSITAALSMLSVLSEVEEQNIKLPNIDLSKGQVDSVTTTKQYQQHSLAKQVSKQKSVLKNNFDNKLGVTTFSWHNNKTDANTSYKSYMNSKNINVSAVSSKLAKKNQNIDASDYYLSQSAFQHGMNKTSIQQAKLQYISDRGVGAIVAKYQQEVDGIEVFNHEINVMMDQELEHIASSGYFSEAIIDPSQSKFMMSPTEAISIAFNNMGGVITEEALIEDATTDKFRNFNVLEQATSSPIDLQGKTRIKQVYFNLNGKLVPAFYTEITAGERTSTSSNMYSYVISAIDGKVLFRNNLTSSDIKTYRVFADANGQNVPMDGPTGNDLTPNPTGTADGAVTVVVQVPGLITLDNLATSTNDPWLVATDETNGNNVDAYVDITAPNGFGGANDTRATATNDTFDYSYDFGINATTTESRNAAVVNLFYVNNFLHDWFYDNGFDEAAGNAQRSNYGRGGVENDPLLAEGQDYSGLNNANMSTPSDGGSPRMQMFLFQDGAASTNFNVDGLGVFATSSAGFGPQNFTVNGQLVQLIDDAVSTDPNDGCEAITNATELAGNIVLINRGGCDFDVKVATAETAGAIAVLMINNEAGNATITMGGDDASIAIGSLMVGNDDGATILNAVNAGVVTATIETTQAFRDGTLDNGVVAHEWGHYLSNRLVANANGLNNSQGGGMGEGWGDFIAQMMIVRESDRNISGNNLFQGTYNSAGYATANYYYGFRRAPYTTDMSKNALTFKHIENDVALPTSHSISFGASGSNNAEVHNAGEVWANMLWEVYVSLLNRPEYTFSQAQEQMKNYLVAGLKMTPASPTFVEARDGILAAAAANVDATDFGLIFNAFAKRGMGLNAVAPNRDSTTHFGVVEDFNPVKNSFTVTNSELKTDVVATDSDADKALDIGDTGTFSITVENKSAVVFDAATAQISSTSDITFSNNGILNFTNLNTFGDIITASLDLTLVNASETAELVTLDITFPTPAGTDPDTIILPESFQVSFNANYDLAKTRSTDNIEVSALSMADFTLATSVQSMIPFSIASASDAAIIGNTSKVWWGIDNGNAGTTELQLPEVTIADSGDFILSFYHYFNFEASEDSSEVLKYWDGGVVEVSIDGGAFQEVTAAGGELSTPYNQTIEATSNMGYGGEGGDESVTLTFSEGTLNGKTAKFRFLITTDSSVGGVGWLIDDIGFSTNTVESPFSSFIQDSGTAPSNAQPTVTVTDSTTVTSGTSVSISATGADTDNDTLTYLWTQVSGPGAAIDISGSNTSATLTFTAPTVTADSSYVFQVVVNDGTIDSAAAQVTVVVQPVAAPPPAPTPTPSDGGGGGGSTEGISLLLLSLLLRKKLKK